MIKERRLNITFVCPADNPSGGMRVVAIYADRLTHRGHKVTIVLPKRMRPSVRERVRAITSWRTPSSSESRVSYLAKPSFKIDCLRHTGPVTDRDLPKADVLIATWWQTAEWVWAASEPKGVKLHFMQDYETWGAPRGDVARVDAAVALPIPKIVIAQWVFELLQQRWKQTPVALVKNSVQTDRFFASPRKKQAVPTVGFTYSTMRNKGCDVIFAAIERAHQFLPNLRVIAFGNNRPNREVPLPPGTEFHFQVEDDQLRYLYAACDAWLFGTRIEGFGLPILEAMACRTPVIGTAAGAAPQLIAQGGGFLISLEDAAAMSDAIVRISAMAELEWRTMSNLAYATATAYTWDDATDKFETAIIQTMRQSAR